MRGDPSERNVPSNATRAAFRRAIPSQAISGAPSIQVKTHQGQNGLIPADITYATRVDVNRAFVYY